MVQLSRYQLEMNSENVLGGLESANIYLFRLPFCRNVATLPGFAMDTMEEKHQFHWHIISISSLTIHVNLRQTGIYDYNHLRTRYYIIIYIYTVPYISGMISFSHHFWIPSKAAPSGSFRLCSSAAKVCSASFCRWTFRVWTASICCPMSVIV